MGTRPAFGCFCGFLIFILTAGIANAFPDAGFNELLVPQFGNILLRARRQTEKNESQPDANTRCVIRNLKDIEKKLEEALPPEKNVNKAAALAKPHQLFSNSDPATVEKFCEIYKASRARLAACGESQMKSFAAKALAVVDFICIDRYEDFIKAFPCIHKVDQELDALCNKNCSSYESAAEKLNSAGAAVVKKYKLGEIKELFAQSCLYVSCVMDCQRPILESKCGSKTTELEMSSIGVTFRNLDELMRESSAYNVWPSECRPLSAMGTVQEKQKTSSSSVSPTATTSASLTTAGLKNGTSVVNGSNATAASTTSVQSTSSSKSTSAPLSTTTTLPINVTSSPVSKSVTERQPTISPTQLSTVSTVPASGNSTAKFRRN